MLYTEYDAVKELAMEREDGYQDGLEVGREEGRAEGKLEMLYQLVKDHLLAISDAAQRVSLPESIFLEQMKKAGY